MRVDIWSDLVCPWCYIGKRRFERALAGLDRRDDILVVHRSFQLDPSMPRGERFRHRDVLMRKYGLTEVQVAAAQARLEQVAAGEGLEYHLAELMTGNTLDAHQVVHLAAAQGRQDAVVERLFRAHFTEERSLFDRDSLDALAAEAGVAGAGDVIDSGRYAAAVTADHQEADSLGIRGVPFFLLDGRYGISGAQEPGAMAAVLVRALSGRGTD